MIEILNIKCRRTLQPVTRFFGKLHPNFLTFIGFLITVSASIFYARGIFWLGGIVLLVGGLFDVLDGEVAELTNRISKFGAFWDSCLDRYSDFIVLFGIFYWYLSTNRLASILALLTILGSFIVSYIRARAEGIGIECKVGLGQRAFRVFIIVIGSFFGPELFVWFLWILVLATNLTAFYRMWYVWKRS